MTSYSVQDMLHRISRSLKSITINRWIGDEVLPMDAPGAKSSVRLCLAVFPQLEAAIDANALRRSTYSMRPLALALTHLAKSPEMLEVVGDNRASALLSLACKVIDAYEHDDHGCIEAVGELMEIVRTSYLPIKLGHPLDVMTTFYNNNLGRLSDDLRLPFLKAGDQYVCQLSKTRLDEREIGVHRPALTMLDMSSFNGWTAHLITHPALTAMFSCTFGTMYQYNDPVWVSQEGDVEPRLLLFVDLLEQLQPHNLKLACSNVDLILVCQLLNGMRIAASEGAGHSPRLVMAAKSLVDMALPAPDSQNTLATNLLKPCLGSKSWLLPSEMTGVLRGLCQAMEAWSEPSDIAPALSAFRRHVLFCSFQAAAANETMKLHLDFRELARVAAPELLEPALQDRIGKKGRSVLADFAIHASNEDLKEMLARTPDLQVRSKIFQDDLGL